MARKLAPRAYKIKSCPCRIKKIDRKRQSFQSEKHFSGEDIEICKYDRLLLVFTLVVTRNRSALKMIF